MKAWGDSFPSRSSKQAHDVSTPWAGEAGVFPKKGEVPGEVCTGHMWQHERGHGR